MTSKLFPLALAGFGLLGACQQPTVDQTGSEYMPDMAHGIAYEANVYTEYYQNTWDDESVKSKYEIVKPNLPVKGTVPRGYAAFALAADKQDVNNVAAQEAAIDQVTGRTNNRAISTPINGHVPYYYNDTEPDRLRAIADLQRNPFPITASGLARGAELYNLFCAICHGEAGDGNGWIYENGAYPAAPRNFLVEEWVDTSAGVYYHAMMYGKNVMGNYKDKVSYEERYQIIGHIRALQAAHFEKTYTEDENDLVPEEATPASQSPKFAAFLKDVTPTTIEVENPDSDGPKVVGEAPNEDVQLGEQNPTVVLDSIPTNEEAAAPKEQMMSGGEHDQ